MLNKINWSHPAISVSYCRCLCDWVVREQEVFCECCGALHKSIKWQLITKRSNYLLGNLCYVSKGYSSIIFNIDFPTITFSKLVSHLKCHSYISCNEISQREKWCVILFDCQTAEVRWWVTVTQEEGVCFHPKYHNNKKGKREKHCNLNSRTLLSPAHTWTSFTKKDSKVQT